MFKKLLNLLSDSATYGIGGMLGQLIGFLLLPLYTRYLTPEDYGVWAMLAIIAMLFGPLANLGMTNAIFRRFNLCQDADERGEVLSTGLASVVASTLWLLLLCQLAAVPITVLFLEDAGLVPLVRLTLLSAALSALGAVPQVTLRADRRVRAAATVNVLNVILSASLTVWLVAGAGLGVLGVVLGGLVASLVITMLYFLLTLSSFRRTISLATWRYMLSYGLPLVPHRLQAVGLALFGQFMVGKMLGLQAAGLYNIAVKVAVPLKFVVGAVQQAWVPYKFQIHAQDSDPAAFFRSATTYYVAGISYLWVGVSLWGPEVLRLMTAESFHAAALLVPFVALIPVSKGLYYMLGTGFEFTDNTKPMPLVSAAGLVVVVLGAFALIPWLGPLGAALATVAGWLVMTVAIYLLAQRRFRVRYDWFTLGACALLSSAAVALAVLAQAMPPAWRLALALVISIAYPGAILLVLLLSKTERNRAQIFLHKLRPSGESA